MSVVRPQLPAALSILFFLVAFGHQAYAQEGPAQIPAENLRGLAKPPPVPDVKETVARAMLFVQAIRESSPDVALTFFFPQDAFRQVKGIKDPDRYHRKLLRVYREDLLAMRKLLRYPDEVEFIAFRLGRQKRWVKRGKEANALPYYATYKAVITVKDGDRERELPVRVMINWGKAWYVTHLTRK